jgi:hypothetical protein
VVEHPLGKGEVARSIRAMGTTEVIFRPSVFTRLFAQQRNPFFRQEFFRDGQRQI